MNQLACVEQHRRSAIADDPLSKIKQFIVPNQIGCSGHFFDKTVQPNGAMAHHSIITCRTRIGFTCVWIGKQIMINVLVDRCRFLFVQKPYQNYTTKRFDRVVNCRPIIRPRKFWQFGCRLLRFNHIGRLICACNHIDGNGVIVRNNPPSASFWSSGLRAIDMSCLGPADVASAVGSLAFNMMLALRVNIQHIAVMVMAWPCLVRWVAYNKTKWSPFLPHRIGNQKNISRSCGWIDHWRNTLNG